MLSTSHVKHLPVIDKTALPFNEKLFLPQIVHCPLPAASLNSRYGARVVVKAGRIVCIACLELVGVWNNCRTALCPENPATHKGPRLDERRATWNGQS
jgi:hypothetical protein